MLPRKTSLARFCFCVLLTIPSIYLNGQNFLRCQVINTSNGLSNNSVIKVIKDTDNFIWILTNDGLNRFDGKNISNYDQYLRNAGSDKTINCFLNKNNKHLIGTTERGILRDLKHPRLYSLHNSFNEPQQSNTINAIVKIGEDMYAAGTPIGIYILRIRDDSFEKINYIPCTFVNDLFVEQNKYLWIATVSEMSKFQIDDLIQKKASSIQPANIIVKGWITQIYYQEKSDLLWFCWNADDQYCYFDLTKKELFRPKPTLDKSLYPIGFSSFYMSSYKEDLFFATSVGLLKLDRKQNHLQPVDLVDERGNKVQNTAFTSIVIDNSGIVYLGSRNKGVFIINLNEYNFSNFITNLNNEDFNNIRSISIIDPNQVLYGTQGRGAFLLNLKQNSSKQIFRTTNENSNSEQGNIINEIQADSDNYMLCTNAGLYFRAKSDGKVESSKIGVARCMKSMSGNFYIGTKENGLAVYNAKSGKHLYYSSTTSSKYPLSDDRIWFMLQQGDWIWFATNKGLNYFNTKTLAINEGLIDFEKLRPLINDRIWCLKEDYDGNLFIATAGSGLKKLDLKTGEIKRYSTELNSFFGMENDSNGNLWIVTYKGLAKFNPQTEKLRIFSTADGLITDNLSYLGIAKMPDGKIVVAGDKGISIFAPDDLEDVSVQPLLNIISFKVNYTELYDNLTNNTPITLPYDSNFISLDFSCLNDPAVKVKQYAYKLDGIDKDWVYTTDRRYASYSALEPGRYNFYIKACDADGDWSPVTESFTLTITPPWWKTWWFKGISYSMIAISILAITLSVIAANKRRNELEKNNIQAELKSLRSQMNPHFVFNSLNAVQHFIMQNDKIAANQYLSDFSSFMRNTLDYSTVQVIPLTEEISILEQYLHMEKMRFENRLEFSVDCDPNIPKDSSMIPTMILQPLVENAVLHGIQPKIEGGMVKINFKYRDENTLFCTVEDTGIGFDLETKKQTSKGLNITAERLNYLGQLYNVPTSIRFRDNIPTGTIVEIVIPLIKES